MEKSVAIIGAGNLGQSIALGIAEKEICPAASITLTRRNRQALAPLEPHGFNLTTNNLEAVASAQYIILCVQPKQLQGVLSEINSALDAERHILISTITGVLTEAIAEMVGKPMPIVRAMPNTAAAIGESMTCLCGRGASEAQLQESQQLFEALGSTLVIEERLMKAATVLGASGIAFCMRFIAGRYAGGHSVGL